VISGSLAGMGPAEALDAALPPSGLRHRIVDGALIVAVDPRPAATTGRSR